MQLLRTESRIASLSFISTSSPRASEEMPEALAGDLLGEEGDVISLGFPLGPGEEVGIGFLGLLLHQPHQLVTLGSRDLEVDKTYDITSIWKVIWKGQVVH